ncbi:MAG: hypothetical protein K2Y37_19250 [Pirellulales bacterium]|nr:hypothetical protein [Pirellulales bacterium]
MKHDFRKQPIGDSADQFMTWLEHATVESLRRAMSNPEALKGAVFLFVNRAYEAHMEDSQIGGLFGKAFVRAGGKRDDEEAAFDLLEFLGEIAKATHANT